MTTGRTISTIGRRLLVAALVAGTFMSVTSLFAAKRVAVVFGTNYKGAKGNIPPLDLCERDARLFQKNLKRYGRFDTVDVFLGRMVTANNVKKTLDKLASNIGPNDTVVLFFAGHGTYTRDSKAPNGMRNTLVMFERPHLPDDTVNNWLRKVNTRKLLWVFDCCFSGGIVKKGRRGMNKVPMKPGDKGKVIQNGSDQFYFQGKALIGSSDSNETSIEIGGRINHGVFTYYFAQGLSPGKADLNRDGAVTALEAFEWSSKRITKMAKRFNHRQHPQISGNAGGIILAGRLKPKPPRPTPPKPVVKPQPKPKPSPNPEPPTPTKPVKPVDPTEPKTNNHSVQSTVYLYTTILKNQGAGLNKMDPMSILRKNKNPHKVRKVRVLISGKEYNTRLRWLTRYQLKRYSGHDVRLGRYTALNSYYKNKAAYLVIRNVPTGVHEIRIEADDYPVIKRRLGVERSARNNKLFVVASVAGTGTIRGKAFLKTFETPCRNQEIWMPTVTSTNLVFKMKTLKDGSFWFLNLPPGNYYQIKPSFTEASPVESRYLKVKANGVTKVDVVLKESRCR